MKKWLVLTVAAIMTLFSLVAYVNVSFSKLDVTPFYDGCKKVWGHRGYFKNAEMNTLASFRESFELGAAGVELDILYDIKGRLFYVSRGYPGGRKKADILKLEDVFREFGDKGYFWLDLKNLVEMNKTETFEASHRMRELLDQYGLREKAIVESKSAWNLSVFSRTGIHTSYWINVDRRDSRFLAWLKVFRHKAWFLYGRFSAVSTNYLNFTPYVQLSFAGIPVHLFTLNTRPEVAQFMFRKNVKVILSDENYYSLSTCEE